MKVTLIRDSWIIACTPIVVSNSGALPDVV